LDYRDLHKNAKRIGLNLMQLKAFRDDWGDRMPPDWKHHHPAARRRHRQ
jgi:hypothetical protein